MKCQETRSRDQNRKLARRLLADRLDEHLHGDQSRTALKAKEEARKKASKLKKSRRKYKKLADGKATVSTTLDAGDANHQQAPRNTDQAYPVSKSETKSDASD